MTVLMTMKMVMLMVVITLMVFSDYQKKTDTLGLVMILMTLVIVRTMVIIS